MRQTDFCMTCHRPAYLPRGMKRNSCNFTCGDPRYKVVEQEFRDLWSDENQVALNMYRNWRKSIAKTS